MTDSERGDNNGGTRRATMNRGLSTLKQVERLSRTTKEGTFSRGGVGALLTGFNKHSVISRALKRSLTRLKQFNLNTQEALFTCFTFIICLPLPWLP